MLNKRLSSPPHSQRGISLILVIFLLIVGSLLVVGLARLNTTLQTSVAREILSVRALFAAESGAQSAAMRIFPINAAPAACPANFVLNFNGSGLDGCRAALSCTPVTAAGRTVYTVSSEGVCGGGNDIARRRLTVSLRTL